jgi:hypothetical protein
MALLTPRLVIPVGKLAIAQFISYLSLNRTLGIGVAAMLAMLTSFLAASSEPRHGRAGTGRELLRKALQLIAAHPAMLRWQRSPGHRPSSVG